MIEINLLPKDYLKGSGAFSFGKTGIYVTAGAIGLIAVLAGLTFFQIHKLAELADNMERANQRAAMLQRDIQLVDGLSDVKVKITQRMNAVEELDRHRTAWVRILENIASNMPEFVWLASFKEDDDSKPAEKTSKNKNPAPTEEQTPAPVQASVPAGPKVMQIQVEGYAFTLNSLAAFMIKMMRSDYFENVELVSSQENKFDENEKAYQFVVSCNLHYLSDEDLRKQLSQAEVSETAKTDTTSQKSLN
ncbi:MAG: PilN domain-containing protein [candidate division Zixibacteria bacterium]|nr:PilN domain-containing protein [candidate division Zixibacteria bacterium]